MYKKIFNDFDRGVLSRRQLLQALGIAALVQPACSVPALPGSKACKSC